MGSYIDLDSDLDMGVFPASWTQAAEVSEGPEVRIAGNAISHSIREQSWLPSFYGSRELPLARQLQMGFSNRTSNEISALAQRASLETPRSENPRPVIVEPTMSTPIDAIPANEISPPEQRSPVEMSRSANPRPVIVEPLTSTPIGGTPVTISTTDPNNPQLFAQAKDILTRAFSPRHSLAMEIARGAKEYSGMFAELQHLRDEKIQKLKEDLPKIYGDLSGSMRYQKWLDLFCGFASGGAQIGSTMATEKTLLHGIMKGLGEGGAVRGIQSFVDAGCQADQTGMQGKKSEKESQREGIIQGGNSADQAFQSFIQLIKDIHQTEQQMRAS